MEFGYLEPFMARVRPRRKSEHVAEPQLAWILTSDPGMRYPHNKPQLMDRQNTFTKLHSINVGR